MITVLIRIITPSGHDTRYGFSFELLHQNSHQEKLIDFSLSFNLPGNFINLISILLVLVLFLVSVK